MIIALAGQKGGSGKTTVAIAVSAELYARKKRVLLVDADPQGSVRTWGAVAAENNLETPTIVAMASNLYQPGQLPALAAGYEHTVVDCPPRHGDIQRAAMMVSDLVVLPCGPSAVDAWAVAESVELINEARKLKPTLLAVVLITRKVARTTIGKQARDALQAAGLPILGTELGFRVPYQEAPAAGLGVAQYAPKDPAAVEVRALVDELLSLTNPSGSKKKRPAHG